MSVNTNPLSTAEKPIVDSQMSVDKEIPKDTVQKEELVLFSVNNRSFKSLGLKLTAQQAQNLTDYSDDGACCPCDNGCLADGICGSPEVMYIQK